jgi:hypothetical protein
VVINNSSSGSGSGSGSGSAAVGGAVMNTVSGKGATTEGECEKKIKSSAMSSTIWCVVTVLTIVLSL